MKCRIRIARYPCFTVLALLLLVGCDRSVGSNAAPKPAAKVPEFFEVKWPPEGGKPGVHYRIPMAYMVKGSVYGTPKLVDSFMVCFEMPGATPCRKMPKFDGSAKQQAAREALRKRYRVVQVTRVVGGYKMRMAARRQMAQIDERPYATGRYRSYDVAGLEQYSHGTCYSPEEMKKNEVVKALAKRPDIDKALPNCNLSTLSPGFVSPPSVTADDDGGYTHCMPTSCRFHFSIEGREANYEFSRRGMGLVHRRIEQWREVVDPARDVIKQWIVRN